MSKILQIVVKIYKQVRGLFPSPLPVGVVEFDTWAASIGATYKLPTNNLDSIKFTLATLIMHSGPTVAFKPKYYFVLAIRASAAKQIAGNAFHEIKERSKLAQAAAEVAAKSATPDAQPK